MRSLPLTPFTVRCCHILKLSFRYTQMMKNSRFYLKSNRMSAFGLLPNIPQPKIDGLYRRMSSNASYLQATYYFHLISHLDCQFWINVAFRADRLNRCSMGSIRSDRLSAGNFARNGIPLERFDLSIIRFIEKKSERLD